MPLVDGGAKTLFNGVSRQPPAVRLPSQVQEAINVHLSVETGGFEKRPGAQAIAVAESPVPGGAFAVHFINRDPVERYAVILSDDGIQVNSLIDGTARTVTYAGDARDYLTASGDPATDFAFVTVADYTFVLNRSVTVLANAEETGAGVSAAVLTVRQSVGTWSVTIDGGTPITGTFTDSDTPGHSAADIATAVAAALTDPEWTVKAVDNYVFIINEDDPFTIAVEDGGGYVSLVHTLISDAAQLPAKAVNGMIVEIAATSGSGYYLRFDETLEDSHQGIWRECAKPGISLGLDAGTMPHVLIRQGDGTFSFEWGPWSNRDVGDLSSAKDPEFVGKTITEIAYFRNRLALLSDEIVRFSAAGDYFNFFPEQTTQVIDSDTFAVSASGTSVALLRYAVPVRKSLFVTASASQFEVVTPDILTPSRTAMDMTTAYAIQDGVRPVVVGENLYLVAKLGDHTALLEYSYEDAAQTSTAVDVSKHARGYLPSPIRIMAGDGTTGTVAMLADDPAAPGTVFLYSFFNQGREKAQSALHKWVFNVDAIYGMTVIDGALYLVAQRNASELHVLRVPLSPQKAGFYPWAPLMDFWQALTGTYDATTDETTFTLPYAIAPSYVIWDALLREDGTAYLRETSFDPLYREGEACRLVALPSLAFKGRGIPDVLHDEVSPYVVRIAGDWTLGQVIIGETFRSLVELSPTYLRDENGAATTKGRLQLRQYGLKYENSAFFRVDVTPTGRETKYFTYDARVVGLPGTGAGDLPTRSGMFWFEPNTEATQAKIVVSNYSHLPMTIASTAWTGTYATLHRKD
jgi:hypothetical protein